MVYFIVLAIGIPALQYAIVLEKIPDLMKLAFFLEKRREDGYRPQKNIPP